MPAASLGEPRLRGTGIGGSESGVSPARAGRVSTSAPGQTPRQAVRLAAMVALTILLLCVG